MLVGMTVNLRTRLGVGIGVVLLLRGVEQSIAEAAHGLLGGECTLFGIRQAIAIERRSFVSLALHFGCSVS